MNKSIKKKKTIITVLLFSIIGGLVFSITSNLFYYNYVKSITTKELISSNESNTEIAFDNIDRAFLSVGNISAVCIAEGRELLAQATEPYSPNKLVNSIKFFSNILLTDPSIKSLDFYFPQQDLILTNSRNIHFDVTPTQANQFLPWLKIYEESNTPALFISQGYNSYPKDVEVITYVTRTPVFSQNTLACLALHISTSFFKEYIREQDNEHFLLFDNNHKALYETRGSQSFAPTVEKFLQKNELNSSLIKSNVIAHNGRDYILSFKNSSALGLTYAYMIPTSLIIKKMPYFSSFFLTSAFLILVNLLTIALITLKNDKVYKKKLENLSTLPQNNTKQLNFDASIEQLQVKFNILNTSYKNSQPIVIQNTLRLLLLGRLVEISDKDFNQLFPSSHVVVAISKFAKKNIQNELLTNALEYVKKTNPYCYLTSIKNDTILVINASEEEITTTIAHLASFIDPLCIKLYLSSIKQLSKNGFPSLYEEASKSLTYQFLYPDEKVLYHSALKLEERLYTGKHNKLLSDIENALFQEDQIASKSLFKTFIIELATNLYTIEYCKLITRDFITVFNRVIIKKGLDTFGIFGYDIRNYYQNINSIKEFTIWIEVCIDNYFEYLKEYRGSEDKSSFKSKIDILLQTTDEKDLTLEYLADKLAIRSDELSKIFKQSYGINYSDYVKELKIAKAKQLLLDGYRVNEIADILGYSSAQYFIKVFKTETGFTPNIYAKHNNIN